MTTVYIVHCIDTEGPLYESLDAKFERLRHLFGVELVPSWDNLVKLKRGEVPVGGREADVQQIFDGHLANYNETWSDVGAMLSRVVDPGFRNAMTDSFGGGWVFNWFFLDYVNYAYNPRHRDMGYHNVHDRIREILTRSPDGGDGFHWHFHPMSSYRDAHYCATHYFRSPEIFEILTRKIIERDYFPNTFRAGFQAERPDSHWFLEQWIPFDLTNMAQDDNSDLDRTVDLRNGRSGDWRLAPSDWSIYHPSHDNYQLPGDCRRWIGRALNVMNRLASIDQREMDKAFARAADGTPTLVGMASHDSRDLGTEVEHLRELVAQSHQRYPEAKFAFSEAREAFRRAIWPAGMDCKALDLELVLQPASADDVAFIEVRTTAGTVFGPQPFLAIQTRSRTYLHDNFDFSPCGRKWFYAFHNDTLPLEDVARIGVAANDQFGNTCIRHLAPNNA